MVWLTCKAASAQYTMSRPNTKIYKTQCTGTGASPAGVVTFRLRNQNGTITYVSGTQFYQYGGWYIRLGYNIAANGVQVRAELLDGGNVIKVVKNVVTANVED